jgi:hypothetical protein
LIGKADGMIDLFETHSFRKISSVRISGGDEAHIHEMRKLSNHHEVGIATR